MPRQVINNVSGAVPPLPVFSQVVVSRGMVYVSGSVGCDEEYNIIGGIQVQTRIALENMKTLLEGGGSDLDHIVKVTVYLSNMARDFVVFNEVYADFFKDVEQLPARTAIGVATLPMGAFVEVECTAELAESDDT